MQKSIKYLCNTSYYSKPSNDSCQLGISIALTPNGGTFMKTLGFVLLLVALGSCTAHAADDSNAVEKLDAFIKELHESRQPGVKDWLGGTILVTKGLEEDGLNECGIVVNEGMIEIEQPTRYKDRLIVSRHLSLDTALYYGGCESCKEISISKQTKNLIAVTYPLYGNVGQQTITLKRDERNYLQEIKVYEKSEMAEGTIVRCYLNGAKPAPGVKTLHAQ